VSSLRLIRRIVLATVVLLAFASTSGSAAPPGAPPSAHCHVTDGAFTVCADGSHEWSDVTPQHFAATNSYLYADQADLDPTLHTSSSPNDTFMLMYDECARRTRLGPDEYLLVNFDTVEHEDGEDKLLRYSVHVFGDGTLIFFENGEPVRDDAGHLRVHEIEGQRAAAGYGPTPTCNYDHVFAEYEIKLTATGLALNGGYSPDPSFSESSTATGGRFGGSALQKIGSGE